MTILPAGVKVHLALGYIDMRKGMDSLAMQVQGVLHQDPFSGHLFVFRGRYKANLRRGDQCESAASIRMRMAAG
jgi:transposase